VTRLDRLGLPVWQAVRPMSRAVSVHQGKGATDADAKVGALLEGVERSTAAETFEAEGPVCRFDALPRWQRAPTYCDFAGDRRRPPSADGTQRWVIGEDLLAGGPFPSPFEIVSLDLTRYAPSLFDRASNGIATGASRDEALGVALQEFVERDAVTEWQAGSLLDRMACTLDLDSVPFPWLGLWRQRLRAESIGIRFLPSSLTLRHTGLRLRAQRCLQAGRALSRDSGPGLPCDPRNRLVQGACRGPPGPHHPDLWRSRRLDAVGIWISRGQGIRVTFGLPLPAGMRGVDWDEISPGPTGPAAIAGALERAGYGRIGIVELGRPEGLFVVRAYVCGLGSIRRRRRAPLP
jgi:ribosomal protein S12 methylthiotransferase accessory factor